METKRTELTKHYWNNEGVYDKEFTQMTETLMKATGRGDNLRAEVVRAANRLYYEYCNNGNCNAVHIEYGEEIEIECPYCHGDGYLDDEQEEICQECDGMGVIYEEGEEVRSMDSYYNSFIDIIRTAINTPEIESLMEEIEDFIVNRGDIPHATYFNDKNMHMYDLMIDLVYEWAVKHENDNTPIPDWYNND